MKQLDANDFQEEIQTGKTLVDFFATWCFPCQKQGPLLESIEGNYPDVKFCKLDVDKATEIAIQYGVMSIPALIVFENGKEINRTVGLTYEDELKRLLTEKQA